MILNKKHNKSTLIIICIEIFLFLILSTLLIKTNQLNQLQYKFSLDQFKMIQLADRLHQSSDDLTDFARSFVITKNSRFKDQYYKTIDIRNGKRPRPLMYGNIYWDLNKETREKRHPDTPAISLKKLFNKLPFKQNELELLLLSEKNSNDLIKLEIEAFNSMLGKFKDDKNNYTIIKEPNQKYAIELLHTKEYYQAKHKIMDSVDKFIIELNNRIKADIKHISSKHELFNILTGFFMLLAIIFNIFIYKYLSKKEKDKMLLEQSKKASMGEMIGNIAHQWRQPLTTIAMSINNIKLDIEMGNSKEENFDLVLNNILNQTEYLSRTIETFRDFTKEERGVKEVIVQNSIDKALQIIEASLKNNYINLTKNIDYNNQIKATYNEGELSQVLINVINNSKDILIQNNIESKLIVISLMNKDAKVLITIEDNAGGIPDEILPKIFEPYFTTKHKSKGTGLGLYMSKRIVEEHLDGKIYAENTYLGAKFFIEFPITNILKK